MKDHYPTRKTNKSKFLERIEPVIYNNETQKDSTLEFYEKYGFIHIEGFFDKDSTSKMLDLSEHIFNNPNAFYTNNEPSSNKVRSVLNIHETGIFSTIHKHPELINLVNKILGEYVYIHQSRINYKAGLGTNGWSWHSDFETWHSQDGMPQMRCLTAMIPLVKNTAANGALMVIPESHKLFWSSSKGENITAESEFSDQKVGVPDSDAIIEFFNNTNEPIKTLTANPGDLILFDCNTIHVSNPNLTPNKRTNLFFVFNHIDNRLVDPFSSNKPRPEEMGARKNIKILLNTKPLTI
jgi:ectoine hydroxylase